MAVTEEDAESLLRLFERQSGLRERVRTIARDERLDELTRAIRDLERRTDERFAELAEAQKRTDERLASLVEEVRSLAEAQKRTDERLAELAQAQKRTDDRLASLIEEVHSLTVTVRHELVPTVAGIKGQLLEMRYRDRAGAYFGGLLRRVKVIEPDVLQEAVEEMAAVERSDALLIDLVVAGTARSHPEKPEVWVAVEVSSVVDERDMARAVRRAALLRLTGHAVVPAVAGERILSEVRMQPGISRVLILEDGRWDNWETALAAALTDPEAASS
jgi:hypothetical protein